MTLPMKLMSLMRAPKRYGSLPLSGEVMIELRASPSTRKALVPGSIQKEL